jgi:hypothetical protein
MMADPTYDRKEIDADPTWKLAWVMSEIENVNAPIGWGSYIYLAEALMRHYEMQERGGQWMQFESMIHNGRDFVRTTIWETIEGVSTKRVTWVRQHG